MNRELKLAQYKLLRSSNFDLLFLNLTRVKIRMLHNFATNSEVKQGATQYV